ncbi:MAG TPA: hypothetical protein VFV14_11560 [Myxococcaceae bacterium]|nr:hypothetical protein [Myxococcaceae bacterium]
MSEKAFQRIRETRRLLLTDRLTIPEIRPVTARPSKVSEGRLNLLIPSINPEAAFGGIATAVKFFKRLEAEFPRSRILLTDFEASSAALSQFKDYSLRSIDDDEDDRRQLVSLVDKRSKGLVVGSADLFIATIWWSEVTARSLARWQAQYFGIEEKPVIYLIQDYEPLFYAGSARSLLATETYQRTSPTIAVINTALLRDYLHLQGHRFTAEFTFQPAMNQKLREHLAKCQQTKPPKEKRILIYGRPYSDRNAFPLVVESLRVWSQYEKARRWEIVSAGEPHPDIRLNEDLVIKSRGKLALADYADLLSRASVGISFMVSPHPSYPPLEMAHFGMKVITNGYSLKDITRWHDNLHAVPENTPSKIAAKLTEFCELLERQPQIGWSGKSHIPWYLEERDEFPFADDLGSELRRRVDWQGRASERPTGSRRRKSWQKIDKTLEGWSNLGASGATKSVAASGAKTPKSPRRAQPLASQKSKR